ncbi:MAG: SusC/RagA family TonB-linked outer membrane protein [Prolixibacteraceae bacterium]|nr:SusC/RagA family TonB-linked outer membrane protein [Prolixibacteraceae bacterium]
MKQIISIKLLVILAIIVNIQLFAQEEEFATVSVKGKVLGENAEPLSNIELKAFMSNDIALTNAQGEFEIDVVENRTDRITIDEPGYLLKVVAVMNGNLTEENLVLEKQLVFDPANDVELPFRSLKTTRTVSSVYTVTADKLGSFPSGSFLDALSGLVPGMVVVQNTSTPGSESSSVQIQGQSATIYVDGVIRDPSDLIAEEVDKVEILKDQASRAPLGIYGSGPAIWISTRQGDSFNREMGFSAEYGMNMATAIPEYTDAWEYATLYNQAMVNDGFEPYYSDDALNAYKNNADPVNYPNINYLDRYVRPSSPFLKANIHFAGGDEKVNYFSMISYMGSEGLEAVGEKYSSDRLKLRGNVNIKLNELIRMNVNISGMYKGSRNPHENIFILNSVIPANAHPISFNDSLIVSNDYPINIENELVYGGFRESTTLSTQNNATLYFDLSDFVEGLSARASAAFDVTSFITTGKYESAPLYRLVESSTGADSIELVSAEVKVQNKSVLSNNILRKTVASLSLNYDRTFGKHAVASNLSYYQGAFEQNAYTGYQPEKMQDFTLSATYTYDDKYTVQIDQVLSGSMRMPKGKRFSYYPTIGAGWTISNEDFLKESNAIDFLKLNASFGIMGVNDFTYLTGDFLLSDYDTYYLYETLWEQRGSWLSGIAGKFGTPINGYIIKQVASDQYTVPKKRYINVGIQGAMFDNSLTVDLNYYNMSNYDMISQMKSYTPSLFGGGGFLPATNFGEINYWGFDGAVQYTKTVGDFTVSAGANALYHRGKIIEWDEPLNLDDYRKNAGKETDEYVMYNALGLFQNQDEIDASEVYQTFGSVVPGDIKYEDYTGDGIVDEKDMYRTGAHAPRIYYGVNISLSYKGFKIKAVGQGRTDGEMMLAYNSYFNNTGNNQNFSKAVLDSWTESNTDARFPRLTTTSINNMQTSSFWLTDASYFRLKNVEVSYTLPKNISRKMLMGNCTVFLRGSNLFETSELSEFGIDPENNYAGMYTYPIYETYTVGVTCMF